MKKKKKTKKLRGLWNYSLPAVSLLEGGDQSFQRWVCSSEKIGYILMKQIYFGRNRAGEIINNVSTSAPGHFMSSEYSGPKLHSCSIIVPKILCPRSAK